MKFIIKTSYNFEVLNLLNILTEDEFYIKSNKEEYELVKGMINDKIRTNIKELINIFNQTMLSPMYSVVISSIPNFEEYNLVQLLDNVELITECIKNTIYYDENYYNLFLKSIPYLKTILIEIENFNFESLWKDIYLPKIAETKTKIESIIDKYDIQKEIENILGVTNKYDEITLYLCSFISPHGVKVCGNNYLSDIKFDMETTIRIAIHEMFHPPYIESHFTKEFEKLKNNKFFYDAFINQHPNCRYSEINGFIEENVVEGMEVYISSKIGLLKNPVSYLEKHDYGSHVFSMILQYYFHTIPKFKDESFENYLKRLLLDISDDLQDEYNKSKLFLQKQFE